MSGRVFARKDSRKSTDGAQRRTSFAGHKALTLAPPPYGIDLVDRSFAPPVQRAGRLGEKPKAGLPTSARGMPMPLQMSIESLSGIDLSGVRVHAGSSKPSRLNARALAQGNDIHLAPGQERHLPHEAWHVVQQRQGRVKPTLRALGVSINDDLALEREADVMGAKAARASQGTTKADAPLRMGPGNGGNALASGTGVVQGYFEQGYLTGTWLQSDDMSVATEKGYPNHKLYAKAGKVAAANQKLAAVGSGIELVETSTSARFSEGSWFSPTRTVDLKKVEAKNKQNNTSGDNMLLYADCGKSDAVVVGGESRQAVYDKPGGVPKTKVPGSPTTMKTAIMKAWLEHEKAGKTEILNTLTRGGVEEADLGPILVEYGSATTDAKKKEVAARYRAKLDAIAETYWAYYNKLSAPERDKIDKSLKINRYTDPDVGQGYTISSGGPSAGKATWNFHWGGVVMTSDDGRDKVVLENYAVGDPKVENKLWTFDIYGTQKKGQTFHERHFETKQHGQTPTTMTIEKEP